MVLVVVVVHGVCCHSWEVAIRRKLMYLDEKGPERSWRWRFLLLLLFCCRIRSKKGSRFAIEYDSSRPKRYCYGYSCCCCCLPLCYTSLQSWSPKRKLLLRQLAVVCLFADSSCTFFFVVCFLASARYPLYCLILRRED